MAKKIPIPSKYECIYCNHVTSDFTREHVVPQMLGTFEPDNQILSEEVCSPCNNKFSFYERVFREDSFESYMSLIYGFIERPYVKIRPAARRSIELTFGGEEADFWGHVFPFIQDGHIFTYKPQIHLRGKDSNIYVVFLEALEKPTKKLLEVIKQSEKTDIKLFLNSEYHLTKVLEILDSVGITYKETERIKPSEAMLKIQDKGSIGMTCNAFVDDDLKRTPAKIAFNYFAYNAVKSGGKEYLYNTVFNDLKGFILGDISDGDSQIVSMTKTPPWKSAYDDVPIDKVPYHFLSFSLEGELLVSHVSIFNLFHYKIHLGKNFFLSSSRLGNAHMFDPVNRCYKRMYRLAQGTKIPRLGDPEFSIWNG